MHFPKSFTTLRILKLTHIALLSLLTACATADGTAPKPTYASDPQSARLEEIAAAATDYEKDRRAILAMIGEYEVQFAFDETVVLKAGYERKLPKRSGAFEVVLLAEDDGKNISLQHLLVSEDGFVTKHWRQDWTFEATNRFEFSEDQTWKLRPLTTEQTRGAWTQCVFEVSDAPRYCGTGRWNHGYGSPTWTSDRTWRPLPRREYTTRSDYNALNAENRHTIVASGWTHEQDNTKTVRAGETTQFTIVREFGFNDYRRIKGFDFSPALKEWQGTHKYWATVRAEWNKRLSHGGVHIKTPVENTSIIDALFTQAMSVKEGEQISDAELQAVFDQWTESLALPPENQVSVINRN